MSRMNVSSDASKPSSSMLWYSFSAGSGDTARGRIVVNPLDDSCMSCSKRRPRCSRRSPSRQSTGGSLESASVRVCAASRALWQPAS
eukprot:CAMPEP_0198565162 /NCGR_PEP_ID=MMETSP1462-20131121/101398_1 /TAXON_ID=1333877 /ORGANISM="Brandtodinium nutriculum, Strain RCC3387" /LENGTH=86 /DNA_ID=CAMNT_0044296151 /DNA_START=77 /DNA_END=337 /DNA_ORIENTATION=-